MQLRITTVQNHLHGNTRINTYIIFSESCVASDLVPSGDVCLGGSCCGERMGYHDVYRAFKCSACAEHGLGAVISGILRRPDV